MISIIWNCHIRSFSLPITILCRKFFLLYRESKTAEISNLFFLFISFNSCGTHRFNFWILSNCFNRIDIVCPVTPYLSVNFFCIWVGFFRCIRTISIFQIKIFDFKSLVLLFLYSVKYSVLSQSHVNNDANDASGLSSYCLKFLQDWKFLNHLLKFFLKIKKRSFRWHQKREVIQIQSENMIIKKGGRNLFAHLIIN